jgi:glucokinase
MLQPKDVMIGIDLGGTSMRALVVDRRNKILALEKIPTNPTQRPERTVTDLAGMVDEVVKMAGLTRANVQGVSIGAPGAVDPRKGIVHHAPNLGWKEFALGQKLNARLNVPIFVENDVNVGVVGEHALGAARGTDDVVGIFVGTGIGGGIILAGELYEGLRGAAGELGHMILDINGPLCGCGRHGCAEALASRTAMERDVRGEIKKGGKSHVLKIMRERGKDRMTSSVILRALRKNDPVMKKVLARAQFYLALLVANVVNLLDPECIVIGGGVAERLGEEYVAPAREQAKAYFLDPRDADKIRVVPGILGDNAGALGAVVLGRKRLAIQHAPRHARKPKTGAA